MTNQDRPDAMPQDDDTSGHARAYSDRNLKVDIEPVPTGDLSDADDNDIGNRSAR